MIMINYHAAYVLADGWYNAEMLDFPGVSCQAKTLQAARQMLRNALRWTVREMIQECKALPKPNPDAKHKKAAFEEIVTVRVQVQCYSQGNPDE